MTKNGQIERLTKRVSELEVELERRGSPRTRLHNPDDPDHYRMPPNGWTCFHCGDTFDHPEDVDHLIERRTDGNKHIFGNEVDNESLSDTPGVAIGSPRSGS